MTVKRRQIFALAALVLMAVAWTILGGATPKQDPIAEAIDRADWLRRMIPEERSEMLVDRKLVGDSSGAEKAELEALVRSEQKRIADMDRELRELEVHIRELMAERRAGVP